MSQWPTVYFEEIYQSMHHSYFTLVYLKEHQQSVTELLNQYSFEPLQYRYDVPPKEAYQQVKERYEILQKEEKALKQQLASYHDFYETFCLAEEVLLAVIQREQARQHLLNASSFFILQTWIPVEEKAEILTAIEEKVPKDEIALTFENPTKAEIETDIPVKLANNKLVQPFEMLTEMYSLPKYEEVDPTPAMMPFYLVFWYDGSGYWLWLTDATLVYYCFESICFTERHETFCRLFLDFIISNNYLGLHLRFVFRCSITANNVWNQITISDFINDRRCKYDSYFIGYFWVYPIGCRFND